MGREVIVGIVLLQLLRLRGCCGDRLTFTVGPGEGRATPRLDIDSEVRSQECVVTVP